MMNDYPHIQKRFKCPKCNNTASVCKEVSLSKVSAKILGGHAEKYLFVSCTLCGYTEIYNLRVLVQATEKERAPDAVLEPHEG